MEWKKVILKEKSVEIPKRWVFLHYYEAYNILFRIENALRVFCFSVLKNELKDKWIDCSVKADEGDDNSIKNLSNKRISQASTFGYLCYSISSPLMYLTGGELIQIITSEKYWPYFKGHFKGSMQIIKNKLNEIGAIRNSLAHFRPIKEDDVEVLKQNAKHALMEVEKYLDQMNNCYNVVPTNTSEEWYQKLKTIGTETCILRFTQCDTEQWVKITIEYKSHILDMKKYGSEYLSYQVLNINSPAILKEDKNLVDIITCLTENVPYCSISSKFEIDLKKNISMLFSRQTLKANFQIVEKSINKLFSTISNENDLIKEDNLARGSIVESASIGAYLYGEKDKHWNVNTRHLLKQVTESDLPEYWGDTEYIPWMPSDISESEPPF